MHTIHSKILILTIILSGSAVAEIDLIGPSNGTNNNESVIINPFEETTEERIAREERGERAATILRLQREAIDSKANEPIYNQDLVGVEARLQYIKKSLPIFSQVVNGRGYFTLRSFGQPVYGASFNAAPTKSKIDFKGINSNYSLIYNWSETVHDYGNSLLYMRSINFFSEKWASTFPFFWLLDKYKIDYDHQSQAEWFIELYVGLSLKLFSTNNITYSEMLNMIDKLNNKESMKSVVSDFVNKTGLFKKYGPRTNPEDSKVGNAKIKKRIYKSLMSTLFINPAKNLLLQRHGGVSKFNMVSQIYAAQSIFQKILSIEMLGVANNESYITLSKEVSFEIGLEFSEFPIHPNDVDEFRNNDEEIFTEEMSDRISQFDDYFGKQLSWNNKSSQILPNADRLLEIQSEEKPLFTQRKELRRIREMQLKLKQSDFDKLYLSRTCKSSVGGR